MCLAAALHHPHKGSGIDLATCAREAPEHFPLCCSLLISKACLRKMEIRKDVRRDHGDGSVDNILTTQDEDLNLDPQHPCQSWTQWAETCGSSELSGQPILELQVCWENLSQRHRQ